MDLKQTIRLNKTPSKILTRGLPWVYSNELEKIDTSIVPGSFVLLEDARGKAIATGFFNPHSLIAFRVYERLTSFEKMNFEEKLGQRNFEDIFCARMDRAFALRQTELGEWISQKINGPHSFRVCFGESDGLPGLIVDGFESSAGPVFSVQCHSAGSDSFLPILKKWIEKKFGTLQVAVKNNLEVRKKEGAELNQEIWGEIPKQVFAQEGGVRFLVDLLDGQKTGFFYDLKTARAKFARKVFEQKRKNIFDGFCYLGAWGLQALKIYPQAQLMAVDSSQVALDLLEHSAELNGLQKNLTVAKQDIFKNKAQDLPRQFFDAVVMDPPSTIASLKQKRQGVLAHQNCFETAFKIAKKEEALMAFASCSYHLSWDEFIDTIQLSCGEAEILLTDFISQSPDHPVLASLKESRYLKCAIGYKKWRM